MSNKVWMIHFVSPNGPGRALVAGTKKQCRALLRYEIARVHIHLFRRMKEVKCKKKHCCPHGLILWLLQGAVL